MCIGHVSKGLSVLMVVHVCPNLCGNLYVHLHGMGCVRMGACSSLQLLWLLWTAVLHTALCQNSWWLILGYLWCQWRAWT